MNENDRLYTHRVPFVVGTLYIGSYKRFLADSKRGWFYRIEIVFFFTDFVLSLQLVTTGPSKCEMDIFFVV